MMNWSSMNEDPARRTIAAQGHISPTLGRLVRRTSAWSLAGSLLIVVFMLAGSSLGMSVNLSDGGLAPNLHLAPPVASGVAHAVASSSTSPPGLRAPTNLPHETPPAPAAPQPAGPPGYNESGRATFFINDPIANPASGNNTCKPYFHYYYYCWNITTEPDLNLTTDGYTGLAYTAFTNQSECPAMDGNATTEVGFAVSTNFGTTWSNPVYLGNPVCTGDPDQNYSSAFEPSLTSLPNGTFVLSYVEYNSSSPYPDEGIPPEEFSCGYLENTRIVVTESYDHGTTWTTPTVINETDFDPSVDSCPDASFPTIRPEIAAFGETLYLAWSNATNPIEDYYGTTYSSWVLFSDSTNGGSSWSTIHHLKVLANQVYGTTSHYATNPSLLVDPSGRLYIAYSTNYSNASFCGPDYCETWYSASILVATSTNNGTTFTYHVADNRVLVDYPDFYPYTYIEPFTTLAYSPLYDETYLVYTAGNESIFCYNEGIYGSDCYQEVVDKNYFQSSSNNGTTWSATTFPSSFTSAPAWESYEYNPSMAVNSLGQIDLQYSVRNDALCENVTVPFITYYCSPQQDMYVSSDDNGTTWSSPLLVYEGYSFSSDSYRGAMWDGFTSSTLTAGTQLLLAWTTINCPNPTVTDCYFPYYTSAPTLPTPSSEVVTSQLYEGPGITVTYNETGLPAGVTWSVNIQGNERDGPAGANLSISGVPPSAAIYWTVPWVNQSYGSAWYATPSVASPSGFAKNTSVVEAFSELVLVNLLSVPSFEYYFWYDNLLNPGSESNAQLSPIPGGQWVTAGVAMTFTETNVTYYPYCICDNLTFQSWTGTGAGSVTSSSPSITFTPRGPVNETANFQLRGICFGSYYVGLGYGTCLNWTYALSFQENGLPAGTDWGISLSGPNGTAIFNSTTLPLLVFEADVGIESFSAWTIPAAGGLFWVPTTSVPSPTASPYLGIIQVNYTLERTTATSFPTTFREAGLPNGTAWGLELGNQSYGMESAYGNVTVAGGTPTAINGTPVYLENGTGYYVSSISVTPYVVNESSTVVAPGSAVTANGTSIIVLTYSPMYRVTVTGSVGGTVAPTAQWVPSGQALGITESALPGFHFEDWTGTGTGSYSGTSFTPSITVRSVETEFGTFRPNAPPTWNLTLVPVGLPAGTSFSVSIDGTTFSGLAGFKVGNLTQGVYSISAPTVYLNSSQTTQFVPTSVASPLSISPGSLNVTSNGTVSITYAAQYALSIATTPGGSVTWGTTGATGIGTYWFNASDQVSFVATPDPHYYFVSWNGTGNGSVTTTSATLALLVLGPVTETAQFQYRPTQPPATFSLAVGETGLPNGTAWSVALGALGASGATASLTVVGLNGTYGLTAPTIYTASGVRWVSNAVNLSTTVIANGTFSVAYSEQYQVSVLGASGGSVTPLGVEWVAPGTVVDLAAVANSTSVFLSWNGTGTGNYTGTSASTTVTVTGPITEQVAFGPQPVSQKSTSTSASNGELTAIGLLVVLLVVGLLVGLLLGRRRSPPPATEADAVPMEVPMDTSDDLAATAPMAEYDEGPGPS
jgi:Divergent InlB B-repeat domain